MTNLTPDESDSRSDLELLQNFSQSHDEGTFQQLVDRYGAFVWSICQRVLYHRQDVEDAFQTTFMVLLAKVNKTPWRDSIAGWLHSVALKTALRIREKRLTSDDVSVDPHDESMDPFASIAQRHLAQTVESELDKLSDGYKTPLVMKYYLGQTARDIASEMSLSVAAVEGRLRRGLRKLKRRLQRRSICISGTVLIGTTVATRSAPAILLKSCVQAATQASPIGGGYVSPNTVCFGKGIATMAFSKPILIAALHTFAVIHSLSALHVEGENSEKPQVLVADAQPPAANEEPLQLKADASKNEWTLHELHNHLVGAVHRHLRHVHDHVLEVLGFKEEKM